MRKRKRLQMLLLLTAFLSSLLGIGVWLFQLLNPMTATTLPLHPEADLYLLTNKGSYALDLEGDQFAVLEKSDRPVAEFVYHYYPRASFDDRYLVLSKGWEANYANYPTGVVSLDFETGKVHTTKTEHYAHTSAGHSKDYFYTLATTTGGTNITQFNAQGEELQTKVLPKLFVDRFFCDSSGHFYIGNVEDQEGIFTSTLLKVDEKDLTILEEIPLQTSDDIHLRFSESVVLDETLYTPLNSIRDNATKEIAAENQLLIKNLETGEEHYATLPQYFPNQVIPKGDYLFIEHGVTETGQVGFTVFNRVTEDSYFVDVATLLNQELDPNTSHLQRFSLDQQGRLFFNVNQEIVCMDVESGNLLSTFSLEEAEKVFYLWPTS